MVINFSDYVTGDGRLVPGFSGIGNFRGRRESELTADEGTIVNYFFTNADSNVYAVRDTLPMGLWALIMGQYARSKVTAKQRLLDLFTDMNKKDANVMGLEGIANAIRSGGSIEGILSSHIAKAERFIEEFGIDYGHASLRDSAPIRLCFEGVSQRATKFLEAAREGAYQEQSTRAVPFSLDHLGMPTEVRGTIFEERFRDVGRDLISLYEEVMKESGVYLKKQFGHLRKSADGEIRTAIGNPDVVLPERVWNGVVDAKAFDIARSLLPQNITTSLGMTLCARRLQDLLTEWQSSELEEMRLLGAAAQSEARKVSSLMKYGNPSDFYRDLSRKGRELNGEFGGSQRNGYGHMDISSTLIASTPDLEDWVLASILLNNNEGLNIGELKGLVQKLSHQERRRIARSQFVGKGEKEVNPKATEIGSLIFERLYDIGAYRDLQRQRGDRQQISSYSTSLGFHIPKEVIDIGKGLGEKFVRVMGEVKELHDDLRDYGLHSAAQYVPVMANIIDHVVTMDPNQLFYQAQLRCQAAGADSYRTIALKEMEQGLAILPSFMGLIPFDSTPRYPLNRLPEAVKGEIKKAAKK